MRDGGGWPRPGWPGNAVLFPFIPSDDDSSNEALYVEQARFWFDSMWNSIAREYAP